MINQLPEGVRALLIEQLERAMVSLTKEIEKIKQYWHIVKEHIKEEISDLSTNINYVQFDLEATRRERDEYKKLLDGDK